MKPVVPTLSKLGVRSILYHADNGKKQGGSKETPNHNNGATGGPRFYNPPEKEQPLTNTFLGFLLNSYDMTIALPKHKLHPVKEMVRQMANQRRTTLQELASLLGMMVAAHPTILSALLHYRHLESAKSRGLRSGHTYEADLEIDPNM